MERVFTVPKKLKTKVSVESLKHRDKRTNIPTEELRDFVADDETEPRTLQYPGLLYARDPSLDPQLVWKGKDEQDQEPLGVPVVPIYIQEKIHPQAIVDMARVEAQKGEVKQSTLFNDFNGISFDKMIDFYRHEQNWSNRMILGDSLLVMTSLAEKEALEGKVQMIYIDPPYGIKFDSNWQVSTRKRSVQDGRMEDITRQPEQIRAFRDTWTLGIHSYLSYMRDRLIVARDLLTESGSIFVQIGVDNVHLIRCLMDEVFGSTNFVSQIVFRKKLMPLGAKTLENMSDYILWYAKQKDLVKYRQLYVRTVPNPSARWTGLELEDGTRRSLSSHERNDLSMIPVGARVFSTVPQIAPSFSEKGVYAFEYEGKVYYPPKGACWVTTREKMKALGSIGRLVVEADHPRYVMYHDDFPYTKITNPWNDTPPAQGKIYVVQTNEKVIARCILMTTDPGDLVLDPTCGSGTSAYVAEQWGRRWITIDTSRVALALARTRLMAAKYPYYLLADSPEGVKKEAEIKGQAPPVSMTKTAGDVKKGFVYERVAHITLKAIANNEEIDVIHGQWQEKMELIHRELNSLVAQSWEEWEIPREPEDKWPKEAKSLLARWWKFRHQRQNEINHSIVRNADSEILHNQAYEDKKRLRVTGPFTVESLSPHRTLSTDQYQTKAEAVARQEPDEGQFEIMILENLKKAGIQNTKKGERLKFDRIEPYAGGYLHAEGECTEKDGTTRRVAICIGPEHGTVGPDLIKDAAKEAVQGLGFDLLVVCGFAFDPHVAEEAKRYGKLTVLTARMNPDLAMGDELLKKAGSANLFMVFGEPDIEIEQENGKVMVEIRGVDIYDPTTGQIRSNSTDDIACWFIDTNYNGESFFVRHAYFTGADKPYDQLKRALRAEINEEAWSSLYTTRSIPFARPETGKIAVKVINHYGDEVLQVYKIE